MEGIKQLGAMFVAANHQIEVASLDAPDATYLETFPLPVYPLGPPHFKYGYSSKLIKWLRTNAPKYDLVVVNGIWQYHSFAVWYALRKSDMHYVVFTHGMLDPWFKYAYPLKHCKKWLYWLLAEYWVIRRARAVLFTSDEERILARQSFRLYAANERVVTYGTAGPREDSEAQESAFFHRFPSLRDKRVLLFMGRIHPKKGCDLIIQAFAAVLAHNPDWHLVMAGPDQVGWQARLSILATDLNIADRISWPGMLTGDVKWGAFRAAELFLLPSHQENFGIVVAEALACGVPALLSTKVNIWREVQASAAGLVAPDDLKGTCTMLETWTEMSPMQRTLMRERARLCFEATFDVRESSKKLLRIYSAAATVGELAAQL